MRQQQSLLTETPSTETGVVCFHCGQVCDSEVFQIEEKSFCCYGCKTVFEILNENNLCEYYNFQNNPGVRKDGYEELYNYLDEIEIRKKLILFEIDGLVRVEFFVPAIHCISCVWLLENLNRINSGILKSEVNFARKTLTIDFNSASIKLSEIASLVASTGYKPLISLEDHNEKPKTGSVNRKLIIQLAIAGFCFGNIMLLSFPEYLGIDQLDAKLQRVFSYLNIFLSIPVVLFSGSDYFISAWQSFKQRQINIDVPIALGIFVLFVRSVSDVLWQLGPGYMDSLAGLVFFLLIGRWFQDKTYESLAFDRDYKSYFPLAVYKKDGDEWKACIVNTLTKGDHIRIRNNEIIPADSILLSDDAHIDYSFVTGESKPVKIRVGELAYAGGRIVGQPAIMTVSKKTSQSHLTSLWNNDVFNKGDHQSYRTLMDRVAKIFTWSVLLLALLTGLYWYWADSSRVWLIVTAVLMVACPCALALAAPFTYGSMLRVFGLQGFYLKNANVVEKLAKVNAVVFDKTGTITYGSNQIGWNGRINEYELKLIKSLTQCSTHPLSMLITKSISSNVITAPEQFEEIPGKGIYGVIQGHNIRLGSAAFVNAEDKRSSSHASSVYVSIDDQVKGYFELGTSIRSGIEDLANRLGEIVRALLSGDSRADADRMRTIFNEKTTLAFEQSPQDKLNFISNLQGKGDVVMMIGDGLNDSGALKQSDVGIAVSDDTGVFTPACDGILSGSRLAYLDKFLSLSKSAVVILKVSLAISLLYNVVGLSFAVTGHLTPLVAAILMPISSISVVVFTTFMVNFISKRVMP